MKQLLACLVFTVGLGFSFNGMACDCAKGEKGTSACKCHKNKDGKHECGKGDCDCNHSKEEKKS